jgi:hypothetical protein
MGPLHGAVGGPDKSGGSPNMSRVKPKSNAASGLCQSR